METTTARSLRAVVMSPEAERSYAEGLSECERGFCVYREGKARRSQRSLLWLDLARRAKANRHRVGTWLVFEIVLQRMSRERCLDDIWFAVIRPLIHQVTVNAIVDHNL